MPSSLPSVEDLADYLRVETLVDDYDALDGVRLYTESMVRKVTGRNWVVASGTPSTRVYAPRAPGQDLIRIHDCVTVSSVTNDGVVVTSWATATGGYQLEPLNGLDWAGEERPYEGIRYIGGSWRFDNYRGTVAVTADWGWAELPEQVTRAHQVLAKDVWEFRAQQANAGFEEYLENKAKMLLKGYRREEAKAGIGGPR